MGDKGGDGEVDLRIEFISEYVMKALKLKPDKWLKLITGDDRHIVYRFFDTPKYDYIIFRVNSAGLLTAALVFPALAKMKMVYFLRVTPDKIMANNFRQVLSIGEMSPNVLLDLGVLADEVFGPMLCNPENQRGWPEVVVRDMRAHVNDLRNLLYELRGEMTSQLLLPMPAGVESIYEAEARLKEGDGDKVDLFLKTKIEGAVIKWSQLVNDLLKEDSLIAFKRTKFPLPLADVEFYSQRLRNFEGLYSQLRDPRVKKMALYLESTGSVYLDCFKTLLRNVIAGIVECRDIVIHQKPLISHFEGVEGCDFTDCRPLIRPMFHCIGLLWGNARYYCFTENLIPLLREVCNLMIQQCTNSCDPSNIFQGEPDEQLIKIRNVISILNHFIETYELNRDKVHTFFPPSFPQVRWTFDFDRVFMRYNVYVKRLKMIETILHATNEFVKLEKVEYSGLRGKILSTDTAKILEEYTLAYAQLGNITYDPADPEDDSFTSDYERFMGHVTNVDKRLATVFSQAVDDCNNLEQFFKFFQIVGDLFHRPIVKKELQPKLTKVLQFMNSNLDDTKEIFDEDMAVYSKTPRRPMIEPFHPPVAGMLWWINGLRKRITMPMEDFITFEDPIIESEPALYMKQKHTEMLGCLNSLEDKLFKAWAGTVPNLCKIHLAKNLIVRDGRLIKVNFSTELDCLLREIRYLRYLEKAGIPADGQALYARNEKLQCDLNRLRRSVAWYNDIREGSHETEVALIEREISAIDDMWTRGVEEFNWTQDFTEWMSEVYAAIDALQQRVLTAQANMRRGLANIGAWGSVPLYNRRENTDRKELLALKECEARYIARKKTILESHAEFLTILQDNYKLFFNIQEEVESEDEEEEEHEIPDEDLDEDELAARLARRAQMAQANEERRVRRRERELEREEREEAKRQRREARHQRLEVKDAARLERLARREALAAEEGGEEMDEEIVEEEELSEDEMADIEEERLEEETRLYRESRWHGYVGYVDSLVAEAVMSAIQTSVDLFETQTDLEKGPNVAFMEIMAELRDPDIYVSPSLELEDAGGLYDMVRTMMRDMFMQATMFPRLDERHDYPNYEDEIPFNPHIIELYHEILGRVKRAINEVIQYASRYEKYSPLWLEDRAEVLENFLRYGRVVSPEELEQLAFEGGELKEAKAPLDQYQKEIDKYVTMYKEVAAMPAGYLFNGWLRLDLKRLNQHIMNLTCKWSHLYKQNLVDHVHTSLNDLEDFIKYATKELSITLDDDDYDGLLKVMGVLNEVKVKQDAKVDEMFEPLREIMYVLKEYGLEFDEDTYEQLELLPEKWRNVVKLATVMKNNVAPVQTRQAALIAKRVALLNMRLQMYRDKFRDKTFFLKSCLEPYKGIDLANKEMVAFEETLETLNKSSALFDIQPAETKNLKACRKELKLIKQLWDYYYLVVGTFDSWKTTPWKKIDADGMDQECKRFTKDLRQLDKEMRVWEPYMVIEAMIKNLMTSLRAVTELQNPAIKDRHWIELMNATKDTPSDCNKSSGTSAVVHQLIKSPPSLVHHKHRLSFEEFLEDFRSLDDIDVKINSSVPLVVNDFRRPKYHEVLANTGGGKLGDRLSKCYSLRDVSGTGMKWEDTKVGKHKCADFPYIFSEHVL